MEQYYNEIIGALSGLFAEQGFHESPDAPGIYLNDSKAVRVEYSTDRKMFLLLLADIVEGEGVDFKEAAGWLFDESHSAKDAAVIAEDFAGVIRASLGIETQKSVLKPQKVSMPTKNAAGTTPGVEAFAKRFLDMYPEYKGYYKESVTKYGEFLYEDFFRNTAAKQLREMISSDNFNKKHLVKLFTMLNDFYAEGDSNVSSIIMFTILGGAFGGDVERFESFAEYYADCPYIKQNGRVMIGVIAKNKKYKDALQ